MASIKFELPGIEKMEKVTIKLEKPRNIVWKGRVTAGKTKLPETLKNHENRKGVYIVMINNKVGYVGATTNLFTRMQSHHFIKKHPGVTWVYFLEVNEKSQRFVYEIMYKYHFFKKVSAEYFA